ncbi:MAG TPA: hypothetical protein P5572_21020 [Phycisphaerae bacterium]|nr:hypothetical protein [Phycisphaerales bacterium]HRX87515.1 hypothetical protein [Phycisphaerae bacterium]
MRRQRLILESSFLISAWVLVVGGAVVAAARGDAGTDVEAILAKYPSAAEVAAEVEQLPAESVAAVREDFDLALRTTLSMKYPPPGAPLPRSGRRLILSALDTREGVERWLRKHQDDPQMQECWKFLNEHTDELTLSDHPQLPVIMMQVLDRGWSDWTAWQGANECQLTARRKWPELHQIYACRELGRLRFTPAIGILIRTALDEQKPTELRKAAFGALDDIGDYENVIRPTSQPHLTLQPRMADETGCGSESAPYRGVYWRSLTVRRGPRPSGLHT